MSEHTSSAVAHQAVAHQFDDAQQQKEAAELGMWTFLLTELMLFGGFFAGYTAYRTSYPDAFVAGSHHLDVPLGAINTAVLICSSLTMALAVHAAQVGRRGAQVLHLILTIVFGAVFLGIKAVEYSHKFHEHLVPGPFFNPEGPVPQGMELYFSFYFAMTGTHALHMVIGIGILTWLVFKARRGAFGPGYYAPVEMTGLYWHFVDIVWIFLYPLLYLLGTALMSEHVASIKSYILIFTALLVLTGVTVAVAYLDLGALNIVVALGIAGVKATLVVLFFMHLKHSHPLSKVFWIAGLLFFAILMVFTMNDYLTREWLAQPEGWTSVP